MWTDELAESVDSMSLGDGARRLTLRKGAASRTWIVRRFARAPRPSEVQSVQPAELFWLPSATPALRTRLRSLDISWVTDLGEIHVVTPWGTVHAGSADGSVSTAPSQPPRVELSPGAATVLQFLLEHPGPASQTRIATAVGLSQPRVSQVMPALRDSGLVIRHGSGYSAANPAEGFDLLRSRKPSVSVAVAWYSVESPRTQLAAVRDCSAAVGTEVRLCGDWAADLLAPWRRPGRIVVHADATVDLGAVGFVPSPLETATLELRVEPIREAWRPASEITVAMAGPGVGGWLVAPVTEVAREISAIGGSDADQAVDELKRAWLRARSAAARGGR